MLKNFSSLKAIISGLQSNPIYRLKKAWSYVLRDKLEIFEELARIFSGENNALAQRELLVREGTARFADTVGENDHHMQKILQKHSENSRVRISPLSSSQSHYSKRQIFVQNIFTSFSLKIFLTIFLVKSKLSTAKKSKTTTFSRVFHPQKTTIFSRNQS